MKISRSAATVLCVSLLALAIILQWLALSRFKAHVVRTSHEMMAYFEARLDEHPELGDDSAEFRLFYSAVFLQKRAHNVLGALFAVQCGLLLGASLLVAFPLRRGGPPAD